MAETAVPTYEEFARLIRRVPHGEQAFTLAPGGAGGSSAASGERSRAIPPVLSGKALRELLGAGIVEVSASGDVTDREIYDAVHASKISTEDLHRRFHLAPRAQFTVQTVAHRFVVSLFHGAPVGSVQPDDAPRLWFWLTDKRQ